MILRVNGDHFPTEHHPDGFTLKRRVLPVTEKRNLQRLFKELRISKSKPIYQ
jgi:hypothetical protein